MARIISAGLLLGFLLPHCVYGQINMRLQTELDSIYRADQLYRVIMASPIKKDSLAKAHNLSGQAVDLLILDEMTKIDKSNLIRVEQIIRQYGYPGTRVVGSPTDEAAWHVIQHSEDIANYFPTVEKAGASKELPFHLVATMQDRLLVSQGEEQLYGSQIWCENSECYVWPVYKAAQVNQRRKQAGFTTTVEQNAKRFGLEYKARSLPKK